MGNHQNTPAHYGRSENLEYKRIISILFGLYKMQEMEL